MPRSSLVSSKPKLLERTMHPKDTAMPLQQLTSILAANPCLRFFMDVAVLPFS